MLWEYQTITFEFTKDGLLGDKYVDEQDMQKTLNELGQTGWELVNALLLQDGVLAFLKRGIESRPQQRRSCSTSLREQENEHAPRVEELDVLLSAKEDIPAHPRIKSPVIPPEPREPAAQPVLSPPFSIEPRNHLEKPRDTGYGSDKQRQKNDDSDLFGGIRIA